MLGDTQNGYIITINQYKNVTVRTYAHEIGHTLGIGEWSSGLMEPGGSGTFIHKRYMQQALYSVGLSSAPKTMSLYNNPIKTSWSHVGKGDVDIKGFKSLNIKSWLSKFH